MKVVKMTCDTVYNLHLMSTENGRALYTLFRCICSHIFSVLNIFEITKIHPSRKIKQRNKIKIKTTKQTNGEKYTL